MVSYLSIGTLVAGVLAIILLLLAFMANRKTTPSDNDRKQANMFLIFGLILTVLTTGMTAVLTLYPSIGQRFQIGTTRTSV